MSEHLFVKPEKLVAAAVGLLEQNLLIPNTFQKEGIEKFQGAEGDAYSTKVEGILPYRTYGWRNDRSTTIQYDELAERKVTVNFGDDVYSGVKVTDEQMTMDVEGWAKFLTPQAKAVGRGLQRRAVDHLVNADYQAVIGNAEGNLRGALIEARKVMNAFNVPDEERFLAVGTDFESELLNDDKLNLAQNVGEGEAVSALREATIGRRFGFNIFVDQTIPSDAAYAYVRSAFVFVSGAPAKPRGATYGASTSYEGIGLSWVVDYDADRQVDRSVVKTFPGFRSVKDVLVAHDEATKQEFIVPGEHFVRGVKLTLDGSSNYPEAGSDLAKATGISSDKLWTPTGRVATEADPANA